jgi:hypothetical protein
MPEPIMMTSNEEVVGALEGAPVLEWESGSGEVAVMEAVIRENALILQCTSSFSRSSLLTPYP